jgi:hypothetical protein
LNRLILVNIDGYVGFGGHFLRFPQARRFDLADPALDPLPLLSLLHLPQSGRTA